MDALMNTKDVLNFSNYKRLYDSRKRLKLKLIEYKGGKCEICGYDKCIIALEFHHLDPNKKDFNIGGSCAMSFEKCKKEVDKCILVCSNCHREIHYEEYLKKQKELEEKEKSIYIDIMNNRDKYDLRHIKDSYKYLAYTDIFKDIENNMSRKDIFKKYHINNKTFNKFLEDNNIEYNKNKPVPNKPNKEELTELLKTCTKSAIARMFGVSWNAVNKWCKKFNL
jgi:hypothetical protein